MVQLVNVLLLWDGMEQLAHHLLIVGILAKLLTKTQRSLKIQSIKDCIVVQDQ